MESVWVWSLKRKYETRGSKLLETDPWALKNLCKSACLLVILLMYYLI